MIIVAWLIVQFCCHSTYVVWKKTRVFSNDAPAYNGAAEMYVTDFLGINNKLCIHYVYLRWHGKLYYNKRFTTFVLLFMLEITISFRKYVVIMIHTSKMRL